MKAIQTLITAAILCTAVSAQAALVTSADGKTVYDTDLNITWLSNANLAASNTFGVSGIFTSGGFMTWNTAQAWIGAMNTANYLGYHDWRLPTTTDTGGTSYPFSFDGTTALGYNNPSTSEMSHLFYNELGNKGRYDTIGTAQTGYGLVNTGPFSNFHPLTYWSGTEYAPNTNGAWTFDFYFGFQKVFDPKGDYALSVMVVRDGQISAVPIPAAMWLLGSGLIGLVSVASKRKAV